MKKLILILTNICLIAFVLTGTTFALTNSGIYMYTVSGNDPSNPGADLTQFEQDIENWFLTDQGVTVDINLDFYAKIDAPSTTTTEGSGLLTLGYESDNKSGTWAAGALINFYSVKAGPQYALYWVDPASAIGTWSTIDLFVGNGNHPEVSHISTWVSADPTAPIPEPTTLLLLGTGLIGIGIISKKRKKN